MWVKYRGRVVSSDLRPAYKTVKQEAEKHLTKKELTRFLTDVDHHEWWCVRRILGKFIILILPNKKGGLVFSTDKKFIRFQTGLTSCQKVDKWFLSHKDNLG